MYYKASYLKNIISYLWPLPIYTEKTKNETLELVLENGQLKLYANGANYSFGTLHKVFERAFKQIDMVTSPPKKVLILGFGVGSVAHILLHQFNFNCSVTGVDNNEKIATLYKRYFEPSYKIKPTIILDDAAMVLSIEKHQYDLIVVDLFVGLDIPTQFTKVEFIQNLKKTLDKGGSILYNIVVETKNQQDIFNSIFEKMNKNFNTIQVLKCGMGNRVLYAKID